MRSYFKFCAAVFFLGVIQCRVQASLYVEPGDTIKFKQAVLGNGHTTAGGEFIATDTTPNPDIVFRTFCLEQGNTINADGTLYTVHSVYENAITGANGGQSVDPKYGPLLSDPLSGKTAWLYLQFWKEVMLGQSSPLNYLTSNTRDQNANTLQLAIWNLEGETGLGAGSQTTANNAYLALAASVSLTDLNAAKKLVRAVNPILLNSDGTVASNHRQSMLYVVPEAATLIVWSVLGAIGICRHRRARLG